MQDTGDTKAADVNAAVEELLNTLSNKFAGISSEIFAKSKSGILPHMLSQHQVVETSVSKTHVLTRSLVDEMSRRLDNLEAALLADKEKAGGSNPAKGS